MRRPGVCTTCNWQRLLGPLVVAALLLPLVAVTNAPVAAAGNEPPRAYPALLQMAKERPNEKVRVIIQLKALEKLPDQALTNIGGKKGKELPLINGLAAELPAKAVETLARTPGVRWISIDAPLRSTAVGSDTVRDQFDTIAYTSGNGTVAWSSNWTEVGEGGSPSFGDMSVTSSSYCAGGAGNCLRIEADGWAIGQYIYRSVNLSGTASATLSLYRNNGLNAFYGTTNTVKLEISADGGMTWTTLRAYTSTEYTGAATDTFDIAAYASNSTRIRFFISQAQSSGRYIYLDNIEISYAKPSPFTEIVHADQVRSANNLTGQGVTVAVIDSGVANHADFQGASGSRIIAATRSGSLADANDAYGHGTHVAGIVGGKGNSSGAYKGVAPGVNLVNVRVSDDQGRGTTSDLVEGLQWVYTNRATYNIRVVNLSLNSSVPESYHTSPLSAAVEILWLNGVVVVAAGNNGSATGPVTIYPPANDPFVITVGATEDRATIGLNDDAMANFSAYGTTEDGFAKPDLVAPGRNLVSTLASTSATAYTAQMKHRVNGPYFRMSGTSMAAPVVSGAVALLLQDEPGLTPDQVKYRLKTTANAAWGGYSAARAGAGYLDAYAAVNGTTTQSANTGVQVSQMLFTGSDPSTWDSVNWNSVNWNSVNWNSVNWNSVNWNSVNWNSALWDDCP